MPSTFPLEIEEIILDLLADEDDKGLSTLKTCSLVCQAFLPICRKHIFGSIALNPGHHPGNMTTLTTDAFERLLRETPEIADYIRKLYFSIQIADLASLSIQESLKRISRLEFLSVRYYNWQALDWSNNPFRPALLHLLHLPTLTHFVVINISVFALSDLIPCANLKYLDFSYFSIAAENTFPVTMPEHSIQLNEFAAGSGTSAATVMKFCSTRRPDGQPIIDFGSLSKIKVHFTLAGSSQRRPLQELFKHCRALTNVSISFWDPQHIKPSIADMLRPSMVTLKHILVNFYSVYEVDDDPLFGTPSEFEEMRTKNFIETVTILVEMDARCRRGDSWGRLDEVLTSPEWFSLKRFSLAIKIFNWRRTDSEPLVVALRKLPETQFPRLSSNNSVSFDFEVIA